jgi:hypothetical protein
MVFGWRAWTKDLPLQLLGWCQDLDHGVVFDALELEVSFASGIWQGLISRRDIGQWGNKGSLFSAGYLDYSEYAVESDF